MARHERFVVSKDSNFIGRLETFVSMTITHIFLKYKESPEETRNANQALSNFIKVPPQILLMDSYDSVTLWHYDSVSRWHCHLARLSLPDAVILWLCVELCHSASLCFCDSVTVHCCKFVWVYDLVRVGCLDSVSVCDPVTRMLGIFDIVTICFCDYVTLWPSDTIGQGIVG